jgi:hypothetical protein
MVKGTVVEHLQKYSQKDPDKPHLHVAKKGCHSKADLLYMPTDNGFKYALDLADTATHLTDAQPMKTRTPKATLQEFKTIYNRKKNRVQNIPPLILMVDGGGEFKKDFSKYFADKKFVVKIGKSR